MAKPAMTGNSAKTHAYLYLAQGIKFLFPLFVMPYLTITLGIAFWGMVAIGQSYGTIIERFIQYSTPITGARDVAQRINDPNAFASTVAGIMGLKLIGVIIGIAITALLTSVVPIFRDYPAIAWGGYCLGAANSLNFLWYFQGVQQLGRNAVLEIAARAISLILILIFVREESDFESTLFCMSAGSVAVFLFALPLVYRRVRFEMPTVAEISHTLREGFTIFAAMMTNAFSFAANSFLLGLLASPSVVGIYAIGERIAGAGMQLSAITTQVAYPKLAALVNSRTEFRKQWRRAAALHLATAIPLSLGMFIAAPFVIPLLIDSNSTDAIRFTQMLSVMPLLTALGNLYTRLTLTLFDLERAFLTTAIVRCTISIALVLILVPLYGTTGMAIAVLISSAAHVLMAAAASARTSIAPGFGIPPVKE